MFCGMKIHSETGFVVMVETKTNILQKFRKCPKHMVEIERPFEYITSISLNTYNLLKCNLPIHVGEFWGFFGEKTQITKQFLSLFYAITDIRGSLPCNFEIIYDDRISEKQKRHFTHKIQIMCNGFRVCIQPEHVKEVQENAYLKNNFLFVNANIPPTFEKEIESNDIMADCPIYTRRYYPGSYINTYICDIWNEIGLELY